ncbi:MAG: hypothetical protein JXI33_06870 [Candidatus Aminicenantes bacterium]|nr:hypothetical protein [Candidatus Aminicenantes bacterium]
MAVIFTSFRQLKKSLLIVQVIVWSLISPVFAQQPPQKEYVQVVNVEMILRVFKDGSPVGGLKKSDFSLYEDGKKSEINGFFEIHRRMAPHEETKKQALPARLFLLFFWVGNPAADVEGALNKFFSVVYRQGDRVILSTPMKTFEILSLEDIERIKVNFLEQWRQEVKFRYSERLQFINNLNRLVETHVIGLVGKTITAQMKSFETFIVQYGAVVQEYQLRELTPDMKALEAMARSLIAVNNDKFALVFFQRDTLPLFDISQVGDHCLLNGIRIEMVDFLKDEMLKIEFQAKSVLNMSKLSERLKSLFIQANTQFHLLFLSPDRSNSQSHAGQTLSLTKSEELFSNWDLVMQKISANTGGRILEGDRMVEVLDQVVSFEDIYYHITYVPRQAGAGKRKIDIRVNQPGMEIIHGRMLELKDLPHVKIDAISVHDRFIRFTVSDFYPISKQGVPTGMMNVYVTGNQTDNEPPRLLLSQASETAGTITLPIKFPHPGTWNVQVRVIDQITGEQAVNKTRVDFQADIPALPVDGIHSDAALNAVLAKAAAYAEKLKKAAFHFFCRENVRQEVFGIDERSVLQPVSRSYWIYDYQIIGQNGKITEKRVLLEKNRKKVHQEKAQLETMYQSFYSFYMPVTILAGEKQPLYHYRLLGKGKIDKKMAWHIAAVRRDHSLSIPWGEVWVVEEDGAVLKIQVEQTSIVGFEKWVEKVNKKGFEPTITTIHEYNTLKNQLRFPSKTTFIERFKSALEEKKTWDGRARGKVEFNHYSFERSRTYFEYKRYHFFSVSTRVEEQNE